MNRIVYAVKMGWIDLNERRRLEQDEIKKADDQFDEAGFLEGLGTLGDVWGEGREQMKTGLARLEAPGFELPDHGESFNPAPEFLEDSLNGQNLYLIFIEGLILVT